MNKTSFVLITKSKDLVEYMKKRVRNYDELKIEPDVKSAISYIKKKDVDIVILEEKEQAKDTLKVLQKFNKTDKKNNFFLGVIVDNKDESLNDTYDCNYIERYDLNTGLLDIILKVQNLKNKKNTFYDYLLKPITKEDFEKVLNSIYQSLTTPIKKEDIIQNVKKTSVDIDAKGFDELLGESNAMLQIKKMIEKVAPTDLTTLIIGESGVGKELIAKKVYEYSKRREMPYITVNCAAISPTLIEAELFGHEKGSFTGANFTRKGIIEDANGGTIFLDEIGDMELKSQAKLLRVIENGELKRVGGNETINVNVRFIAATNRDLEEAVENGTFRQDLYFRLMNFPLYISPLRDRKEDLPILINFFFRKIRQNLAKEDLVLTEKAIKELLTYNYPGNVRELKSILERMVVMTDKKVIEDTYIIKKRNENLESLKYLVNNDILDIALIEKALIIKALKMTNYNKVESAKVLGMGRTTLYDKLRKYKLENYKEEE